MTAATDTRIYFAGGMFPDPDDGSRPPRFDLVHASQDGRPYLTTSKKGLKILAGHSNLYQLSRDHTRAHLVQTRNDGCAPKHVSLTPSQIDQVERAIHTGYFFI